MRFMARSSLFRFAPFGWLIDSLGAIAIDRDGSGLGGLKETLRVLKHDELVMIFPEGTLTREAGIRTFGMGGFVAAQRAGVPACR